MGGRKQTIWKEDGRIVIQMKEMVQHKMDNKGGVIKDGFVDRVVINWKLSPGLA